ncbi:MAG TPA: Fic family protein [Candidatus Eubacterium avistercoris]|uniref:Fic family protein n=1 Tax=Candidatus Eubacterium avistercoris TaxID=2838567 RepID=A0A9D2D3C8_9FIRM|nr:Fic family protein [Candidatus Eubacterium avistercoris]
MDYDRLYDKKEKFARIKGRIAPEALESFDKSFDIEYAHNSTAIEGNTLTLIQTKAILEDGLSIGGKTLREIYEVANHAKAFAFVKKCVAEGKSLDESIAKDIHALLMENILVGGVYRNVAVRISGAGFRPPLPNEMFRQVKDFFADLPYRTDLNPIELAAWTHAEFVKIHPFVDGNGRTSRMLMNYQLMFFGFLPVSIDKETRLEYFEALEAYAVGGNLKPFAEMIAALEEIRLDEYLSIICEQPEDLSDQTL